MSSALRQLLEQQKALLIAVATGGPRIQVKLQEYAARRQSISQLLAEASLPDPIPFCDLWQWFGKWSDGTLPTYQSRRDYISNLLQPTIDALSSDYPSTVLVQPQEQPAPNVLLAPLDIFISHSGKDSALAGLLANLLRNALSLPPQRIRCTSVDGYRLEVGASTNEKLRVEVREARAFITLLTRNSLASTYVLFEMGARWGAGQYFVPLLAGGISPGELNAPLSGFSVLDLASRAQVSQFLENVAEELSVKLVSRAGFEAELSDLVARCGEVIDYPVAAPFRVSDSFEFVTESGFWIERQTGLKVCAKCLYPPSRIVSPLFEAIGSGFEQEYAMVWRCGHCGADYFNSSRLC
jgi:hypothetical protein